jgi:hypothetical protein
MKGVYLITWMLLSVILVCSVFGLLLFVPKDVWEGKPNTPSTWSQIGLNLSEDIFKQ